MSELIVILLIVVILFGANRLPQMGASLGQGIRAFRKALSGEDDRQSRPPSGRSGKDTPKA